MKKHFYHLLSWVFSTSIVGSSLWASTPAFEHETNVSYNIDNFQTQRSGTPIMQANRIYKHSNRFILARFPKIGERNMRPNDVKHAIQNLDSIGFSSHPKLGTTGLISSLACWYQTVQNAKTSKRKYPDLSLHKKRAQTSLQVLKSNPNVLQNFSTEQRAAMAKLLRLLGQKFKDPIFKNYIKDILACFPESQKDESKTEVTPQTIVLHHLKIGNSPNSDQDHKRGSNFQAPKDRTPLPTTYPTPRIILPSINELLFPCHFTPILLATDKESA